ncbi:MAG: (2Fe-2S)-binding protein [Anaerolineales bacterium]|jgi:aerobic-type carbon monoxide dehydrogenase small subunit (CoxS/CutS family)
MAEFELTVNGDPVTVDVQPDMPLLWVLRDILGLTGTKFSCGEGLCGACAVHVDGEVARSCVVPISEVAGKSVTTIEGLSPDGTHPLQIAWNEESVPQCGYCQPGQVMTAAGLLAENPNPSDEEIEAAMAGTLCRCGTYNRIRRAIHLAVEIRGGG